MDRRSDINWKASIRIAILQRSCPQYRVSLFREIANEPGVFLRLFIGTDMPSGKLRSVANLDRIDAQRLPTKFFDLFGRTVPYHSGLMEGLKEFCPDVILCEGESNCLNYIQAILYKAGFDSSVVLLHWCFTSLPGENRSQYRPAELFKYFTKKFFDGYVAYSSFSRQYLLKQNISSERILTAVNVGDVETFMAELKILRAAGYTRAGIRLKLGLPEKFTVIYSGALEAVKRPDLVLEIANILRDEEICFLIIGDGSEREKLVSSVILLGLRNVHILGRVAKPVSHYYAASDVLVMPGRGGIVLSEALACGVPVLAFQGDGTERDLISNWDTGVLLEDGSAKSFAICIRRMIKNTAMHSRMSENAEQAILRQYNTTNMVRKIVSFTRQLHSSKNFVT